eukprot:gb/GECH01008024.1/.p1 GENE.gb/GECH01008024.1/~~gb/GECH01008024.1/.p1  ORF type:complete len:423 (+),score=57.15 gb/GECH01008024.1/:1-1269(+)
MPKQNPSSQHQRVQDDTSHTKDPSSKNADISFDDSHIDYEDPYRNAENVGKGSFLFDFIRQLRVGTDLLRVSMPAHILEQRSFLEKLTDFNAHPFLLIESSQKETEEERFLNICRWYLSGWHRLPKVGVKKPYNPILGEIFKCGWEHNDDSVTSYFAEQVSHHPPVSAFFMENRQHHVSVEGYAKPSASFRGQTATMNLEGEAWIRLGGTADETYRMTFPDVLVRGIIWGTLGVETVGHTSISCAKTGYSASFEFTKKKEVKGTIYHRQSPVYKIHGNIYGFIHIGPVHSKPKDTFVDIGRLDTVYKTVEPTRHQEDHESRRAWYPLTIALEERDFDRASREKNAIENRERELRYRNESENKEWQPRHFQYRGPREHEDGGANDNNEDPGEDSDDDGTTFRWRFVSPKTRREDNHVRTTSGS